MIAGVKEKAYCSKDYLIMIVDDYTSKIIFKETCEMFDLIKDKVYHVEKVEKARKRFPHTDAIYFISPTKESLKHLLLDYESKQHA